MTFDVHYEAAKIGCLLAAVLDVTARARAQSRWRRLFRRPGDDLRGAVDDLRRAIEVVSSHLEHTAVHPDFARLLIETLQAAELFYARTLWDWPRLAPETAWEYLPR